MSLAIAIPSLPPLSRERLRAIASEAWPLLPVRTALELAKLARELRERPLLREAVRAGEVSVKKAEAVLPVARGEAEVFWVARAKRETVRALLRAARGGTAPEENGLETVWVELETEERATVDEAMGLAGQLLGAASPRWQRLEAMCQEFLGAHPDADDGGDQADVRAGPWKPAAAFDLEAWLETEYERWHYLYQADPVPAPEAGVSDLDRARRIDARLRELAAMRRGWDELLGHLCLLLVNTGLWRDMQFADLGALRPGAAGDVGAGGGAKGLARAPLVGAAGDPQGHAGGEARVREGPARRPVQKVIDRDHGWCTVPGCSRPAVHAHHIRYRSHGGGDDEANQTGLCAAQRGAPPPRHPQGLRPRPGQGAGCAGLGSRGTRVGGLGPC